MILLGIIISLGEYIDQTWGLAMSTGIFERSSVPDLFFMKLY